MLIGHLGDGVTIGAVEVDEPYLRYNFCGLGLDGIQISLAEPAVDSVISVAGGGDDLWHGECIGDVFEFLFEPSSEADGQRGRKSCFARSGFTITTILCS